MKKSLALLSAVCILFTSIPSAFAATLMRGDCSTLIGPAQRSCLRRQERQKESTNAKQWRIENSNLIPQRRLLNRSDLKDRTQTTKKSAEELRQERMETLRENRLRTRMKAQNRYEDRKERRAEQAAERSQQLRTRFRSVTSNAAVNQSDLRSRSRRLQERAQERRDAIKEAHEKCKSLGVTERLQCLQDARASTLEK